MIAKFLQTTRSKEELRHALEVMREFKECESTAEWAMTPFEAWTKLEQMEEFWAHLVEGAPLAKDTVAYIERFNAK